jgi:hypothetical protein
MPFRSLSDQELDETDGHKAGCDERDLGQDNLRIKWAPAKSWKDPSTSFSFICPDSDFITATLNDCLSATAYYGSESITPSVAGKKEYTACARP